MEDVSRARVGGNRGITDVVVVGPYNDEVFVYGHRVAKEVGRRGVARGELGDLGPCRAVVHGAEDVSRARVGGITVVVVGPYNDEVFVYGHRVAKEVERRGVARGELGDPGPYRAVVRGAEDVGRARFLQR